MEARAFVAREHPSDRVGMAAARARLERQAAKNDRLPHMARLADNNANVGQVVNLRPIVNRPGMP